jgi:hypothetical protein
MYLSVEEKKASAPESYMKEPSAWMYCGESKKCILWEGEGSTGLQKPLALSMIRADFIKYL